MNRREFIGASIATVAGLFVPRKTEDSISHEEHNDIVDALGSIITTLMRGVIRRDDEIRYLTEECEILRKYACNSIAACHEAYGEVFELRNEIARLTGESDVDDR